MLSWAFEHRQREHVEFLLQGWGTGSMFVSDMNLSSPPPPNILHIPRQKRKWRSSVGNSVTSFLLEAPQTTELRAHKENLQKSWEKGKKSHNGVF